MQKVLCPKVLVRKKKLPSGKYFCSSSKFGAPAFAFEGFINNLTKNSQIK